MRTALLQLLLYHLASGDSYGHKKCHYEYDTVYETVYHTIYKKACTTHYNKKCHTEYQHTYETKYHPKCHTSYHPGIYDGYLMLVDNVVKLLFAQFVNITTRLSTRTSAPPSTTKHARRPTPTSTSTNTRRNVTFTTMRSVTATDITRNVTQYPGRSARRSRSRSQ